METPGTSVQPTDAPLWEPARFVHGVQVFGGDRAVGREVLAELLRAGHPLGGVELYGRRRCTYTWHGKKIDVRLIGAGLGRADLAFVCTEADYARQLVPLLLTRGTRVVDLSGAYRHDEEIQLVVDEVNGRSLGAFTEVVALPSGTANLLARLLWVFLRGPGLEEADCVALLSSGEDDAPPAAPAKVEDALRGDVTRLLGRSDLRLDVSAVDVDRARCDTFVVKLRSQAWLDPERATALLAGVPGIEVEAAEDGPQPSACAGSERIHVGRIRAGSGGPGSLCFIAVGDQLRAGAAQAALRVGSRFPTLG